MSAPGLSSRLSLILDRAPEDVFEPDSVSDAPMVPFEAYAEDSRVFGWVRLNADRLTDLLNAYDELHLANVEIESLTGGTTEIATEILVLRDQLIAVHAGHPRGDENQRRRTRKHPVAVQARHYLIGGYVHAAPGVDPIASLRERPPIIPLTEAWIEYWSGGQRKRQWVGTLVVNRDLTDSIRLVTEDDLSFGRLRHLPPQA